MGKINKLLTQFPLSSPKWLKSVNSALKASGAPGQPNDNEKNDLAFFLFGLSIFKNLKESEQIKLIELTKKNNPDALALKEFFTQCANGISEETAKAFIQHLTEELETKSQPRPSPDKKVG